LVLVAYALFRKGVIKCALGVESCGYIIRYNTKNRINICKCDKLYYITLLFLSLVSCYRSIVGCESSTVWWRRWRNIQVRKRLGGESSRGRIDQGELAKWRKVHKSHKVLNSNFNLRLTVVIAAVFARRGRRTTRSATTYWPLIDVLITLFTADHHDVKLQKSDGVTFFAVHIGIIT